MLDWILDWSNRTVITILLGLAVQMALAPLVYLAFFLRRKSWENPPVRIVGITGDTITLATSQVTTYVSVRDCRVFLEPRRIRFWDSRTGRECAIALKTISPARMRQVAEALTRTRPHDPAAAAAARALLQLADEREPAH